MSVFNETRARLAKQHLGDRVGFLDDGNLYLGNQRAFTDAEQAELPISRSAHVKRFRTWIESELKEYEELWEAHANSIVQFVFLERQYHAQQFGWVILVEWILTYRMDARP